MRAGMVAGIALSLGLLAASAFGRTSGTPQTSAIDASVDSLLHWRRAPFAQCADRSSNCEMFEVALVELVTRPEVWNNRRVAVSGFLHLEFEGDALYPTTGNRNTRDGLWFDTDGVDTSVPRRLNDHDVRVVGTFRAASKGHMGLFAGSITEITRVH